MRATWELWGISATYGGVARVKQIWGETAKKAPCTSKSSKMLISQPCLRWRAGTDGWIHSGGGFWSTLMLWRISRFCSTVMWCVSLVATFILKPVGKKKSRFLFSFCAQIKSNREVTVFHLWSHFGSQKRIINKKQNPSFTSELVSLLHYKITEPEWKTKVLTNRELKDRISRLAV